MTPSKRGSPDGAGGGAADAARDPQPSLAEYEQKRDFARTPEPAGGAASEDAGPLTFVVQAHAATRLHYDLRIELDGAMPSWPVPKGPSADPSQRRLAIRTEDHPLDYATFEGVIPKGEYGAGEVIVWDNGTYSPDEGGELSFHDREEAQTRVREGIERGKLSLTFRGRRMRGSWALVKTSQDERSWLLLKHRDDAADPERDLTAEQTSVISGLTLEDLRGGRLPDRTRRGTPARIADLDAARPAEPPQGALAPMQATAVAEPFSGDRWLFEPKLDGIRAIARIVDGDVRLFSRTEREITARYPALVEALARQPAHAMLLDGEIVALDGRGVPSFKLLQQRMNRSDETEVRAADAEIPVLYFAFDLLHLDGFELTHAPLEQRKDLLARVLLPSPHVQLVEHVESEGEAAFRGAIELGLEGVVAKRRDSIYEPGRRSRHWLKVKGVQTADFVVGGFTPGNGARAATFGALLLGVHDRESGELSYAGRVGTGFRDAQLVELRARLDELAQPDSPFVDVPPDAEGATWVRPEIVAEVAFTQRTSEGVLRAPSFRRLRLDRLSGEVYPEAVGTPPPSPASPVEPSGGLVEAVLEQLLAGDEALTLQVGDAEIAVTNLDKVMWPESSVGSAVTKRDLIAYYAKVWPWLAPHIRDRPLTLTRYPNGIEGDFFYQKHYDRAPSFVESVPVFSESEGGVQGAILCNNLATLIWLGQVADLALHTSLARVSGEPDGGRLGVDFTTSKQTLEASTLNYPDFVLFDLDPYIYAGTEATGEEPELNRVAYQRVVEVAQWLKELLDAASLSSFVKTSGATGLHIYVPVLRDFDYRGVRGIAQTFGDFLLRAHPGEVTLEWATERRRGKIFFDVNQNARIKNLAAPFSPRAKPGAPVSMPLRWDELPHVYPTDFTIHTAPQRLAAMGDPWAGILDAKHDLTTLLDAIPSDG